jgi:hypothetical protein
MKTFLTDDRRLYEAHGPPHVTGAPGILAGP